MHPREAVVGTQVALSMQVHSRGYLSETSTDKRRKEMETVRPLITKYRREYNLRPLWKSLVTKGFKRGDCFIFLLM